MYFSIEQCQVNMEANVMNKEWTVHSITDFQVHPEVRF